jgi:hypothetical protein
MEATRLLIVLATAANREAMRAELSRARPAVV